MAAPEQPNLIDELQALKYHEHISNYLGMQRGNWGDSDNAWQEILQFIGEHYNDNNFDQVFEQSIVIQYGVFTTGPVIDEDGNYDPRGLRRTGNGQLNAEEIQRLRDYLLDLDDEPMQACKGALNGGRRKRRRRRSHRRRRSSRRRRRRSSRRRSSRRRRQRRGGRRRSRSRKSRRRRRK